MAKIFSSLEVILSFKFSIFMVGLGLGFYYEVKVVFGRFASILKIEKTAMVQVDPDTKEPLQAVCEKKYTKVVQ